MAEASLNFDESLLDQESSLYQLYTRLYNGMVAAGNVTAPDFSKSPPLTSEGGIDTEAIAKGLQDYSTILLKNSAYLFANSISNSISVEIDGVDFDTSAFLTRSGDSMSGNFAALYGFSAGRDGIRALDVTLEDNKGKVDISGNLSVTNDVNVAGVVDLSSKGLNIEGINVLSLAKGKLQISHENVVLSGNISVDGEFHAGYFQVNDGGVFWGDHEVYHGGNANSPKIDWSMLNASVYGDFEAIGEALFGGNVIALNGVNFGHNGSEMMHSEDDGLHMSSDLSLGFGFGLKLAGNYIVKARDYGEDIVSFSAPGMVMNLGDSDGETATRQINLQTGIYNNTGAYRMVSQIGDGYFPNSFSAGCGNSGPTVIQTYYTDPDNYGFVASGKMRLAATGPSLYADSNALTLTAPFLYVDGDLQLKEDRALSLSFSATTSLFRDLSISNSCSAHFNTEAEMFVFDKPTESKSFAIISERYKTMLLENALLFDDGIFLEGVTGGILHNGDALFSGSLGSTRFASGFAGYGWNISYDAQYGGIAATFDNLTVRKKMRIYELEVQKQSVTNGAIWVSDACSGDTVVELN